MKEKINHVKSPGFVSEFAHGACFVLNPNAGGNVVLTFFRESVELKSESLVPISAQAIPVGYTTSLKEGEDFNLVREDVVQISLPPMAVKQLKELLSGVEVEGDFKVEVASPKSTS